LRLTETRYFLKKTAKETVKSIFKTKQCMLPLAKDEN